MHPSTIIHALIEHGAAFQPDEGQLVSALARQMNAGQVTPLSDAQIVALDGLRRHYCEASATVNIMLNQPGEARSTPS